MTEKTQRRLAAILAADVAGYSKLVGLDEEGTLSGLRSHRVDIVEPLLRNHGGRIANTAGDSFLIEFSSSVDAVRFAIAMQRDLDARNLAIVDGKRLRFRIGIHISDVVVEGDDLLGDGVNVAARIESLTPPGGIALSDDVYRQIRGRVDAYWSDAGLRQLKNIADPMRIWIWSAAKIAQRPSMTTAPTHEASIAVLPFDNMSNDAEQDYFADGITEDITTELSRIPDILVISRNSSFAYKAKATKIQDICRDLDVRYVVEGSVRKAGPRVRVTAQLIDGSTGGHLWAERYDRELDDIFAVQDDVTGHIVEALEIKLANACRRPSKGNETASTAAYDLVLRGREQYRLFTNAGNAAARTLFEQATAIDPDYAEPFAGIAETYVQDWLMGMELDLEPALQHAEEAALRDPALPLVQEALSTVYVFRRQHQEAIAAAESWIELEPSSAEAYATLAGAFHWSGRNEEIIPLIDRAKRLNPHYPFYYPHYIGLALTGMDQFSDAVIAFDEATALNPDALWPHMFLAVCHGHLGNMTKAGTAASAIHRIHTNFSITALLHLLPYKSQSDTDRVVAGLTKSGV